ncbi:MAG: FAD-binding oxidoreductase [Bacilli bacterium]
MGARAFYAPDPSSHKYSSIGEYCVQCRGLRALKYGCTRENLAALSVCLPNGETVKCGLPLRKFSAYSNLRDLFVGSEGTLVWSRRLG